MFGSFRSALRRRDKAKGLPTVAVSRAEFIRRLVANGGTATEAAFQARIATVMGSAVMVGNALLRIEEDAKEKASE